LTGSAIDCIYLFDVSNCIDPFAAFDPKKTNGTTKANWEHNTWTASPPTNSVNWNIKASANPKTDGISSTSTGSNPDTVLTFCVYTDRPPVQSTFAVNTVYYTSASAVGGSVASGFFTYWTPGCPANEPPPLPEGCEHRFHMAQVYPVAVGAGGFI